MKKNNSPKVAANLAEGSTLPAARGELNAKELALCSSQESREKVNYSEALEFMVLPLGLITVKEHETLTVLSDRELDREELEALRFHTGAELKVVQCTNREALKEAIFIAYRGQETDLAKQAEEIRNISFLNNYKSIQEETIDDEKTLSIPAFLKRMLEVSIAKGGSDLILVPYGRDRVNCTVRIDGKIVTLPIDGYTVAMHNQLLNRVRILGKLPRSERDAPQDGVFKIALPHGQVEVRFHIFPTVFGEKICFRLPTTREIPSISELGLSDTTRHFLEAVMLRTEGAIILSGPTGSGKTTTLYSIISALVSRNLNVVSLEDPVERIIKGASQSDISKGKITYARGLKEILRQDPDVILIGEIRDEESAKTALEAATTGHLVLSAVHGARALPVFNRLSRLVGDKYLVSQALSLIICQRLLPKLCPDCKVLDLVNSNRFDKKLYQPAQCPKCSHTGYLGRVLIDESLFVGADIEKLLLQEVLEESQLVLSRYYNSMYKAVERYLLEGVIDITAASKIAAL